MSEHPIDDPVGTIRVCPTSGQWAIRIKGDDAVELVPAADMTGCAGNVYVHLAAGEVASTREVADNMIVDRDETGRVLGVEVLGATNVEVNGKLAATPMPGISRAALVDRIARCQIVNVRPVNGVINISAESMADAIIPVLTDAGIPVQDGDQP